MTDANETLDADSPDAVASAGAPEINASPELNDSPNKDDAAQTGDDDAVDHDADAATAQSAPSESESKTEDSETVNSEAADFEAGNPETGNPETGDSEAQDSGRADTEASEHAGNDLDAADGADAVDAADATDGAENAAGVEDAVAEGTAVEAADDADARTADTDDTDGVVEQFDDEPYPKVDPKELALNVAFLVAEDETQVGNFVESIDMGDGITDFRFQAAVPGYENWQWSVTLFHDVARDVWTVCESSLIPVEGALLAPPWIPWKDRLEPSDLSPTDSIGTEEDDPRLEDGYRPADTQARTASQQMAEENELRKEESDPEAALQAQKVREEQAEADSIAEEYNLSRRRVMSEYGRSQAAERWYGGPHGPKALSTRTAGGKICQTCGFYLPLKGDLGRLFGVCANKWSPDDGKVVSGDHGCGEHSEIAPPTPTPMWIQTQPALDDTTIEIVHQGRRDESAAVEMMEDFDTPDTKPQGDDASRSADTEDFENPATAGAAPVPEPASEDSAAMDVADSHALDSADSDAADAGSDDSGAAPATAAEAASDEPSAAESSDAQAVDTQAEDIQMKDAQIADVQVSDALTPDAQTADAQAAERNPIAESSPTAEDGIAPETGSAIVAGDETHEFPRIEAESVTVEQIPGGAVGIEHVTVTDADANTVDGDEQQ